MSIRIKDLPPKAGKVRESTKIPTEDVNDETNKTRMVSASDISPLIYAASDEDSPLSTGILYTTESSPIPRTILAVILSLKNAPIGSSIEVDILKETGVNTDVFATIFTTKPIIEINEFTSETAPASMLNTSIWEGDRRMQIVLTINDTSFAASGLKVIIKS